jgi:hypothetical protein
VLISAAEHLHLICNNISQATLGTCFESRKSRQLSTGINNMSLNITSDGSPTPRKTVNRFAMVDGRGVNTSPDVLGAVGSHYPAQIPTHFWPSSLTSAMQGVKRPLAVSTRSNQLGPQQHTPTSSDNNVVDGYKVCLVPAPSHYLCRILTVLEA